MIKLLSEVASTLSVASVLAWAWMLERKNTQKERENTEKERERADRNEATLIRFLETLAVKVSNGGSGL